VCWSSLAEKKLGASAARAIIKKVSNHSDIDIVDFILFVTFYFILFYIARYGWQGLDAGATDSDKSSDKLTAALKELEARERSTSSRTQAQTVEPAVSL
jgi:hypothetical protein